MRKIKRRVNQKSKSLSLKKYLLTFGLAIAATVGIGQSSFANTAVSNNLPVPNCIDGAKFEYNSGVTFNTNAGALSAAQQAAAAQAADNSTKLNLDLGNQANAVAKLNYNTFNIAQSKNVNFNFGAAGQAALNKITTVGDQYASKILGNMTQSGSGGAVFLINPNGILFGANSCVNLSSFTASTLKEKSFSIADRTITLERGENAPRGIKFEDGAKICTTQSAVFVSNGIVSEGADIQSYGNVQLVTADGVTFQYNYDFQAQPVVPDQIVASTATPDQVVYPDGTVDPNSAINIKGGTVKANKVKVISKINSELSSPLAQLINLDGVVEADTVDSQGGQIYILASNESETGRTGQGVAGVNVAGTVKTDISDSACVCINSDKLTIERDGGEIVTDKLSLKTVTPDKDIFFGEDTLSNIYHVPDLDLIKANKINIGNNQDQDVKGDLHLEGKDGMPVDLTLLAKGDIDLNVNSANSDSILNFTCPNDLTLQVDISELSTLNLGDVKATGDISIETTSESNLVTMDLKSGGSIDILSRSNLTTEDLYAEKNIDLRLFGGFRKNVQMGNITSQKNIMIRAGEVNSSLGDIKASNDVNLQGGLLEVKDVCASGNIVVEVARGFVDAENLASDKDIIVNAGDGGASFADVSAKNDIFFSSSEGGVSARDLNAGNNINLRGGFGGLVFVNNLIAQNDIEMAVSFISIGEARNIIANDVTAYGNVLIDATIAGLITTNNIVSHKDVNIISASPLSVTTNNIIAEGSIFIEALGEGSVVTQDLTSGNNINLTAKEFASITTNNLCAENNINIKAGVVSNVEDKTQAKISTGNLTACGNISIEAEDESCVVTKDAKSDNKISIKSGDFFPFEFEDNAKVVTENLIAASDISIETAENSSVVARDLKSGNNISLLTRGGSISVNDLCAENNVSISGTIATNNIKSCNDIDINGDISTNNIKASGKISIRPFDEISTADISSKEDVSITTSGNSKFIAGNITTAGDISIDASDESCVVTKDLKSYSNIDILGEGFASITTADILAQKNIDIKALGSDFGDVKLQLENLYSNNNINLDFSGADVYIENVKAKSDVNLSATYYSEVDIKDICACGNITIGAERGAFVYTDNLSSSQNIEVDVEKGSAVVGNISAKQNILLSADEGTLKADNLYAGNNISLKNFYEGQISANNLTAKNDIEMVVAGDSALLRNNINVNDVTAGGNVLSDATLIGSIAANNIKSQGNVSLITSSTSSITTCDITACEDISIDASEESCVATNNLKSGNDINILGKDNASITTADLFAKNDININTSGARFGAVNIETGNLYSLNNVDLYLANVRSTFGNIKAKNDLILFTGQSEVIIKDIYTCGGILIETSAYGGNLDAGNLASGQDIRVFGNLDAGNLCAKRDIALSVGESIINAKNLYAGNNINLKSGFAGRIWVDNVAALNDIEMLITSNTFITSNNIETNDVIAGGNVLLDATLAGSIETNNIKSKKDVSLISSSASSITINDITACGNICIDASGGSSVVTNDLTSYSNIDILRQDLSTITVNNLVAKGNISIDDVIANGSTAPDLLADIEYLGDIKADGNIDISGRTIDANNICAGGYVKLTDACTITAKNIDAGVYICLNGNDGAEIKTENLNAGDGIQAIATNIATCDITANSNVDLWTTNKVETGYITTNANLTAGNKNALTDQLQKAQEVKTGDINAGGNVEIAAQSIETGNICANGFVDLSDDLGITTQNITACEYINLESLNGDIRANDLNAGGNVYIVGSTDTSVSTGNIIAGNDATIVGKSSSVTDLVRIKCICTEDITAERNIILAADKLTTGTLSAGGVIIIDTNQIGRL